MNGYLDKLDVKDVVRFESEVHSEIRANHGDLLKAIANEKELSSVNEEKLKGFLDAFVEKFQNN